MANDSRSSEETAELSSEVWQLDQAVLDAELWPRPEVQIKCLKNIRDRWHAQEQRLADSALGEARERLAESLVRGFPKAYANDRIPKDALGVDTYSADLRLVINTLDALRGTHV